MAEMGFLSVLCKARNSVCNYGMVQERYRYFNFAIDTYP